MTLVALSIVAVSLSATSDAASSATAAGSASTMGVWSDPFPAPATGIHATLLHTGEVLLLDRADIGVGSVSALFDPVTGEWTDVTLHGERNLFCSGHSVLADGRVYVTGGQVYGEPDGKGVVETNLFDPATEAWSEGPDLFEPRWYPTNVQLPDGSTLILSGQKDWKDPATSVERYNPETNQIQQLPQSTWIAQPNYPRSHLLPNGLVMVSGQGQATGYLNLRSNSWRRLAFMSTPRFSGTSVLLPGLDRVLALGGERIRGGPAMNTAEIIDLSAPVREWQQTAPMANPRTHANAVLLPDGTVLVVGGGTQGLYENPVKVTELFDPETETWTTLDTQVAPRIYHSTAVLLPDGRVLSSGMDSGPYQNTAEVFSPPYLFQGPRPTIASAPSQLGYWTQFGISSPEAETIERVALIRAGSTTHSFDMEQRYLDVPFRLIDPNTIGAVAPTAFEAPPGWYMLFLIDGAGVPSVASWVQIGATPALRVG